MATKPQHKQLQPHNRANAALNADGLKLHLRTVRLPKTRQPLTVLTLRAGTRAAFSTNYFHHTHHIISDQTGSRLLARLLWGLAFAKTPGTVVLLYGEHLRPTPFDADPSLPILLVPAHLTPVCNANFHALKTHLHRLGPPEKTVRWRTHGLDALFATHEPGTYIDADPYLWGRKSEWNREVMRVRGGFLCYCAPPAVLREQACRLHQMQTPGGADGEILGRTTDYHYLDEDRVYQGGGGANGEVQIFSDYHRRLSVARVARREVQKADPLLTHPERLREKVHAHYLQSVARRDARLRPSKRSN